jgi:hypothetical protein
MKVPRFVLCSALALTLCLGSPPAANGQIGASKGQIAGGIAGIGAGIAGIIITVAVIHSHHVLAGCVVAAANGPQLKSSDAKSWTLEGDSANIKAGDRVKVHGSRIRHAKAGPNVFKVDRLVKDYGPCEVSRADARLDPMQALKAE